MHIRVILQARMSSARLPAKVLLPVSGIPLAILCAKRVARNGLDLVLATSSQKSDDALVDSAKKHCINVYRGDLNNVLSRFIETVEDLSDDDLVVRVTADNPVVDADFVKKIIDLFKQKEFDYLGTHSPVDGLPYGLSAEIMTVNALRKAYLATKSKYDLEHVTPWILRNLKCGTVEGVWFTECNDLSYLRCTVDSFDDYLDINEIFKAEHIDAVKSSWKLLVDELIKSSNFSRYRVPFMERNNEINSVIALGTVQLGLEYGVANQTGMPDSESATTIVRQAIKYGVNWIDTARGYGISEQRVGKALSGGWLSRARIVTKLDPLTEINELSSTKCIEHAVNHSVYKSMHSLQTDRLDVLLLHRWEHRNIRGGEIWKVLLSLKENGLISELGASIYNVDEAIEALADSNVSHLQMPFNLIDHRWLSEDFQNALRSRPDVRIHIRSAFLQGLLISDLDMWPQWDEGASSRVKCINELVIQLKRKNKADLCMAFLRAYKWVDSVVIGVETIEQLEENLNLTKGSPLTLDECAVVIERLSGAPERLINPSQW